MSDLPEDLIRALEAGEVSEGQLKELIRLEAEALGLGYDEAVARARARRLPRDLIGTDLEFLVDLLPAEFSVQS